MSIQIDYPSHRSHWADTPLHKELVEACDSLHCDVRIVPGDGDIFYVFVVPRTDEGGLKAGYHYVSRSLPALGTTMFEQFTPEWEEVVGWICDFVEDVDSSALVRRDQLSDAQFEEIILRF